MKTPTPLIIDEALPLHTYLELINDATFDPVYVPENDEPRQKEAHDPLATKPREGRFTRLLRALPLI